ncbi:hypothetical protein Lmor_0529 [Legionella moravica]|uniref:Uncharacterized protein n=1 Tax=Legionella moravica TaxID=39962 RepID=A0A378JXP7_9GAMM|nr:hypothetical protein [Legionella moravica]KTD37337.1 hypothetical protein Lmor_0529 [Legionella moravica]STX63186.1 Uncharacterised protein [Legionella moravica]
MHNLPKELYHGQVVGKMSFIVRTLEQIDPEHLHQGIRVDFQTEIDWIKGVDESGQLNTFETIEEASKMGKCPDLDTLSRKALIIQELDRLVTLIKPFAMNKEQVESMYIRLKDHPNLWSSFYHQRLNQLEQLNNSIANLPESIRIFVHATVTKLKIHLAENGLSDKDPIANELFKLSINMRDMGHTNQNTLFSLFVNYINSQSSTQPFANVLSNEERSEMISALIAHHPIELSSETLKTRLHDLKATREVDADLLNGIDNIFKLDNELKTLRTRRLGTYTISDKQVEKFFSRVSQQNEQNDTQHTEQLCKLFLLSKAFPAAKEYIEVALEQSPADLEALTASPEFLHQIIVDIVYSNCSVQDELETQARDQLLTQLYAQLSQQGGLQLSMDVKKLYQFINNQVQKVLDGMPQRKNRLESLGFGIPTFNNIEALINTLDPNKNQKANVVLVEFYTAIQKAKETHLYLVSNPSISKQIEEITANDFNAFFKECCDAGKQAIKQLEGNRSGVTAVVDVLRSIANWGIYILSLGTTPQFFKKTRTAADDVAQAVHVLKDTITSTLEHIDFSQEPNQNIASTI